MLEEYRGAVHVDLSAIRHNLTAIKEVIGENVKLCAVIKADGYGHGAVPVACAARGLASWFAVATFEEAMELRSYGIMEPVLILGFTHPGFFEDLIRHHIRPNIYTLDSAVQLSREAERLGEKARIHIKIDTGMSRLGFLPCEASVEEIVRISRLPGIEMEGIFTHFTSADEKDKTKTWEQVSRFRWMVKRLEEEGVHFSIRHCANSAGIMEGIGRDFDMVRAGIITYGLYPSDEVDRDGLALIPALELKSHIIHLKTVGPDTGISYGSIYVTDRPTRVATVPLGYADGYPRLLSNRGEVLIRGRRARILGRVCMDQFMVDVTDIPGAAAGDEVTLIGRDGEESISADEVARLCGTISYEIVCGLHRRIPRTYMGMDSSHIGTLRAGCTGGAKRKTAAELQ